MLGGMAAPAFLFMAGIAVALAAAAHMRRGASSVRRRGWCERRGWQIFLYAFLFRLQSYVLGGLLERRGSAEGGHPQHHGAGHRGRGVCWRLPGTRLTRALALAAGAARIAMVTPAIRDAAWLTAWPDPLEWYLQARPRQGHLHAVSLGGVRAGRGRAGAGARRRAQLGAVAAPGGSWPWRASPWSAASYGRPGSRPLFPTARFWTSSPAFFALRVGVAGAVVPWPGCGRSGRGRALPPGARSKCWAWGRCLSTGSTSSWSMAGRRGSPAAADTRAGRRRLVGLHGGHVRAIAGLEPAGPSSGPDS